MFFVGNHQVHCVAAHLGETEHSLGGAPCIKRVVGCERPLEHRCGVVAGIIAELCAVNAVGIELYAVVLTDVDGLVVHGIHTCLVGIKIKSHFSLQRNATASRNFEIGVFDNGIAILARESTDYVNLETCAIVVVVVGFETHSKTTCCIVCGRIHSFVEHGVAVVGFYYKPVRCGRAVVDEDSVARVHIEIKEGETHAVGVELAGAAESNGVIAAGMVIAVHATVVVEEGTLVGDGDGLPVGSGVEVVCGSLAACHIRHQEHYYE